MKLQTGLSSSAGISVCYTGLDVLRACTLGVKLQPGQKEREYPTSTSRLSWIRGTATRWQPANTWCHTEELLSAGVGVAAQGLHS